MVYLIYYPFDKWYEMVLFSDTLIDGTYLVSCVFSLDSVLNSESEVARRVLCKTSLPVSAIRIIQTITCSVPSMSMCIKFAILMSSIFENISSISFNLSAKTSSAS